MQTRKALGAIGLAVCLLCGGMTACHGDTAPSQGAGTPSRKGSTAAGDHTVPAPASTAGAGTAGSATRSADPPSKGGESVLRPAVSTVRTTMKTRPTPQPVRTTETTATQRQKGEPKAVPLNDAHIRYSGRTWVTQRTAWMDWSASGFDLNVRGGAVRVKLNATDSDDTNCAWIGVYVDGKRTQKRRLKSGSNWYALATDLPEGQDTNIRVVKLNEAQMATVTIQGLEITGDLAPRSPERLRKIVWIGDSITCGFGILAEADDPFTSETEDATLSYASLVSDYFGADQQIIAASGYGVATSNAGSTTSGLLPQIYPYFSFPRGGDRWDYTAFQPDLVVVNLGTNDVFGGSSSATLTAGVRQFLSDLRSAHPHAAIVWAYGMMLNTYADDIRAAVEAFAAADHNAFYVPLPPVSGTAEAGSGGHPNAAAHRNAAAALCKALEKRLGWKRVV